MASTYDWHTSPTLQKVVLLAEKRSLWSTFFVKKGDVDHKMLLFMFKRMIYIGFCLL